jgi:iron complex outermembrane receptor protein
MKRNFILLLLVLPYCCAVAFADDMDVAFDLSLEELMQIKITGATLSEENLLSVPSAVTVISSTEIERLGFTRLDQLMNFIPGYQSYRTDSNSQSYVFSSRGRRIGNAGREVLILLDGMRINDDWAGGSTSKEPVISLANVERVEFMRGPGSAIYGSNAFLGVINIITNKDKKIFTRLGDHQEKSVGLQWYWEEKDTGLSFNYHQQESTGERLDIYDPDITKEKFVASKDPYQWKNLDMKAHVGNTSLQMHFSEFDSNKFYAEGFVSDEINFEHRESYYVQLSHDMQLSNFWTIKASFVHSDKKYHAAAYINKAIPLGHTGKTNEREPQFILNISYNDNDKAKAVMGVEYRKPELTNTQTKVFGAINSAFLQAPETSRSIKGVFGQYQYQYSEQWSGILGFRLDEYSDFGSNISPRVGAIYHLSNSTSVKLLYAQAFRAPSRVETDIENSNLFIGNPDLKPEVATTSELILSHVLAKGGFQVTLFNVEIKDAIVDADTPEPRTRVNSGRQTISGIEIEWQQELSKYWFLRTANTWVVNPVARVNSESERLSSLSFSYQNKAFSAAINANYQSEKRNRSQTAFTGKSYNRLGGKTLFSLTFSYQWSQAFESYFTLENALDKKSFSPAERQDNVIGATNKGALFTAGLRWQL